jgi:hypothetical protein
MTVGSFDAATAAYGRAHGITYQACARSRGWRGAGVVQTLLAIFHSWFFVQNIRRGI